MTNFIHFKQAQPVLWYYIIPLRPHVQFRQSRLQSASHVSIPTRAGRSGEERAGSIVARGAGREDQGRGGRAGLGGVCRESGALERACRERRAGRGVPRAAFQVQEGQAGRGVPGGMRCEGWAGRSGSGGQAGCAGVARGAGPSQKGFVGRGVAARGEGGRVVKGGSEGACKERRVGRVVQRVTSRGGQTGKPESGPRVVREGRA